MKFWMLYKKIPNLRPIFYAYTEDKDLLKRFKKERKQKYFAIVEHELDYSEFKQFQDEKYKYRLIVGRFRSRHRIGTIDVELIVPETELLEVYLRTEDISVELGKYTLGLPYKVFSENMLDALNDIGYFAVNKFNGYPSYFKESLSITDMFYNNMEVDALSLWLYFNGDTLNEEAF